MAPQPLAPPFTARSDDAVIGRALDPERMAHTLRQYPSRILLLSANITEMRFPDPLIRGALIRRYKRFLADVELDTGTVVTAHCANSGSMMGLAEPGSEVWLSPARNPDRKLRFSWEMIRGGDGDHVCGVLRADRGIARARVHALPGNAWPRNRSHQHSSLVQTMRILVASTIADGLPIGTGSSIQGDLG